MDKLATLLYIYIIRIHWIDPLDRLQEGTPCSVTSLKQTTTSGAGYPQRVSCYGYFLEPKAEVIRLLRPTPKLTRVSVT